MSRGGAGRPRARRGRALALAGLLAAGLVHLGCGGSAPKEKILVYARGADSLTLDPANASEGESVKVVENLFEGLVEYEDTTTAVRPCLATAWTVSPDGLQWTFTLRQGVTFHDGAPLTADDVVFTFERQYQEDHPYHEGEFIYWNDMFDVVEKVVKVDEQTVRFYLSRPYAPFLSNLAMFTARIVRRDSFAQHGSEAYRNPVGTGPFKLRRWVKGERLVLERHDGYWREKAKLDRVVYSPVKDNTVRLLQAEKGAVHVVDQPNPHDLSRVEGKEDLEVIRDAGMNVAYLAMNTSKAPFDDVRVRRAVAAAVDRREIAEALYYGAAVEARGMLPPTLWGYNHASSPPKKDLAMAQQLMREAGQRQGVDTELWFMDNPRPYMPQPKALAEYLKEALAPIGIRLKLQEFEWGAYLEKLQNGEHPMCLIGWTGDNGDPDNFLYVLLDSDNARPGSASNYSFYRNAEVHDLLAQATRTADRAKRTQLYHQVDEIVDREVPVLPLVHTEQLAVVRKGVTGFRMHPTGTAYLRTVDLQ